MNANTINNIIAIVTALLPAIEQYGSALLADVQQLLAAARDPSAASPDQLKALADLSTQCDAKQDAIFAALQAQQTAEAGSA